MQSQTLPLIENKFKSLDTPHSLPQCHEPWPISIIVAVYTAILCQ